MSEVFLVHLPLDECHYGSTLVQVLAWCRQQQAITGANVDPVLCRHMVSLGPNEF